jgi:hypothetical protein
MQTARKDELEAEERLGREDRARKTLEEELEHLALEVKL